MKKDITKGDIVKIIILVIIIVWIICFFIDYFRARQSKMPLFCIQSSVKDYNDGTVESCLGLGYKVYKYYEDDKQNKVENEETDEIE